MRFPKGLDGFKRHSKIIIVVFSFFAVFLAASALIVYYASLFQVKSFITNISNVANQDISYKDGVWDTSRYDSEPLIPGNFRIYVFTKDGFVIDRWRPIPGYLDTSNYKQLLTYQKPTTIVADTGQTWRLYSVPIKDSHGNTVGVITTGKYGEDNVINADTDSQLISASRLLLNKMDIEGSSINTSKINVHDIPFEVAFKIVDQYNKIHIKSNNASSMDRLPNYIDPSYITNQLNKPTLSVVKDSVNGERFLVKSIPIKDHNNFPIGTIIVARTISPIISLVFRYFLVAGLFGLILLVATILMIIKILSKQSQNKQFSNHLKLNQIERVNFIKDDCTLNINDRTIKFTYATNQFYLCLNLFSSPKKKWETDELIEKFGMAHSNDSWRKIYDAAISINKKVSEYIDEKLIIVNNKTFQLNPKLVVKITKQNR